MARERKTSDSDTDTTTINEGDENMEASTSNGNENKQTLFQAIDDENILADVLAGARGKGDYKTVMEAFINAGIRLAQIPLDSGLFDGKKPQTVKTGFDNVKTSKAPPEGADQVQVVKKNDQIYLLNKAVSS